MILAIDTSLGTSVAVVDGDETVFAERVDDSRRHAEVIGELLQRALDGRRARIDVVVAGMGPGAFTGLRVGIAAARAAAIGLGVPCVGIASHEGFAAPGLVHVTTDVRRRERAWSVLRDGTRIDGPHLAPADAVPAVEGARRVDLTWIDAAALAAAHTRGAAPVAEALYLRDADAVPAATRKRVSQA